MRQGPSSHGTGAARRREGGRPSRHGQRTRASPRRHAARRRGDHRRRRAPGLGPARRAGARAAGAAATRNRARAGRRRGIEGEPCWCGIPTRCRCRLGATKRADSVIRSESVQPNPGRAVLVRHLIPDPPAGAHRATWLLASKEWQPLPADLRTQAGFLRPRTPAGTAQRIGGAEGCCTDAPLGQQPFSNHEWAAGSRSPASPRPSPSRPGDTTANAITQLRV